MSTEEHIHADGAVLEVDEAPASNYSDYESEGFASSTQSITSSIQEHVYANGRRYHRKSQEERYMLPSDETEQDRLDLTHHLQLLVLAGALHLSPLGEEDPHNVLDCGTGTGIWALDFGETHPGSRVIGVDLAPIQPSWTYNNVSFEVDDLERDWTYRPDFFNFIHSRMVGTSIKDWARYTKQMFHHCAPGGWVELGEHSFYATGQGLCADDDSILPDSPMTLYLNYLMKGLDLIGSHATKFSGDFFKEHLENAGFVDVKVHTFKVPYGHWAKNKKLKQIGATAAEVCRTGLEAHGLALMTQVLGLPLEEANKVISEAVETMDTLKEHRYHVHWQIYGRKPE